MITERYSISAEHRDSNNLSAKILEEAAKRNTPELTDFAASPIHREWKKDQEYVDSRKKNFETTMDYHARALEHVIQLGIAQGRLLNNPRSTDYLTEPIWVTDYDDIANRVDTAATVHTSPELKNDGNEEEITFGIDLTTNPNTDVILLKILKSTNDRFSDYPVGFSKIKYYRDADQKLGKRMMIPHYCVGMDSRSVDEILDNTYADRNTGNITINHRADVVPSFKMLYEINAQNQLYKAILKRRLEANPPIGGPDERKALENLETLDLIYSKELERFTKAACAVLYIFEPLDAKGLANRLAKDDDKKDQTFVRIVQVTHKLRDRVLTESDPNWIEKMKDGAIKKEREKHSVPREQRYGQSTNKVAGMINRRAV